MPIKTEIKTVTPSMCSTWLDVNKNNRILDFKHIATLARTIVKGDWTVNGESLKFDVKGNVLDGQHRMWACIEANKSFKTLITTGLPRKAFDTIDTGRIRTASDILSINGEQNVHTIAAALKHIGRYYDNSMFRQYKYTNREIEDLLEQHPDVRDYAHKANVAKQVRWCSGSVIVTAWYLASRVDVEKADEFFNSFIKGINLEAGSIILVLRNKFIDVQSSHLQRLSSQQRLEMIINSWNLWRKGKTIKHFRLSSLATASTEFPSFK